MFRSQYAGLTQLGECHPYKLEAAGSRPASGISGEPFDVTAKDGQNMTICLSAYLRQDIFFGGPVVLKLASCLPYFISAHCGCGK